MKRLLPIPQASAAARQITRTAADRWQPPATAAAAGCLHCAALFSTTPRSRESSPLKRMPASVQAMPRGAYYDVLITSPPPYSNAKANEPPVTAQTRIKVPTAETPKAPVPSPPPAAKTASPPDTDTPKPAQPTSTFTLSEAPAAVHAARLAAEQAAAKEARQEATAARARIVFGSRLAGPMERENRLAEIRKRSRRVAGVLLPPKPTEPDNCCMSGCVNCVWDRFRDEMEEWAMASAEVQRRLAAQKTQMTHAPGASTAPSDETGGASPISMDDDGGGSDTNWSLDEIAKVTADAGKDSNWEDEIFKGVPVGIREFMKQEKRLKMKHMQEGTLGG